MFGDVTFAQAPFASLGGNSYFRTVEEAAAASATQTVDSVRGGLILETATGTAAQFSSGNSMLATVAETATATAAQTVIGALSAAIAELATGADTTSFGPSSLSASIAESATGTDLPSASSAVLAAIAEAIVGSDSFDGSRVFFRTVEETATGASTQATSLVALATIQELAIAYANESAIKTISANVTGVQLYVNVGGVLIWVVIDDSQDPNWQNIPT